jgi:AhpD family alkylhydroperoxidase
MRLDNRTKKLIAVGASIAANCRPCLEYYVGKALEDGVDRNEIMEGIEVAKMVRNGAASNMDKFLVDLDLSAPSTVSVPDSKSGCCS